MLNDPISRIELSNRRGSGSITIYVETRVFMNDRSKTERKSVVKTERGTRRGDEAHSRRVFRKGKGRSNERSVEKEDDRKKKERLERVDFSFFHIPKE